MWWHRNRLSSYTRGERIWCLHRITFLRLNCQVPQEKAITKQFQNQCTTVGSWLNFDHLSQEKRSRDLKAQPVKHIKAISRLNSSTWCVQAHASAIIVGIHPLMIKTLYSAQIVGGNGSSLVICHCVLVMISVDGSQRQSLHQKVMLCSFTLYWWCLISV